MYFNMYNYVTFEELGKALNNSHIADINMAETFLAETIIQEPTAVA